MTGSHGLPGRGIMQSMDRNYWSPGIDLTALYADHIESLQQHYDRALQVAGAAHAVVFSGAQKIAFMDDMPYPFKANPNFVAWLPQTQLPLSYVVYTPGETPRLIFFQPRDYWHVVPDPPAGYWTGFFDIRIVHTPGDVAQHLPDDRASSILIGEIEDASLAQGIERINPSTAINVLHFARGQKTEYEIACMRASSRRGAMGHIAAENAFRDNGSELDIHRAYCAATDHTDNELPYSNIVALNDHGAVLHYTNLDRSAPTPPRSFLIDAGAQVNGYASDITRSYSYADPQFESLIARMDALQLGVIDKVTAGKSYVELHIETHLALGTVLIESGLANSTPDTLLESGVTSAFLPHGLGHLLGIQVHDVGGFLDDETGRTTAAPEAHPFLRLTRELREDMVLTIEPGLYVIDMLLDELRDQPAGKLVDWAAVDWLRPFGGIRIEDNIRVTSGQPENLTRDAFSQLH